MSSLKVTKFYAEKEIFLTGSTGIVGIVLLEKILRSIPNTGTVYLLIRPKFGKPVSERLKEIKKSPVFNKLLETKTIDEIFDKVKVISGDVTEEYLGLSQNDRRLLVDHVNVIFHCAATIDYADTLKQCVKTNVMGTRKILDLCSEIRNLDVLVHVSSSYAQTWNLKPEEKVYDLGEDVEKIIKLTQTVSDEKLLEMTPELLGRHPHQYPFSKYLAELEVVKMQKKFPCTIVRPGIICGIWQEPIPNCPINTFGTHDSLLAISKGVLRRIPGHKDIIRDYIPVDTVCNNIMVAGCHAVLTKPKEITIFHATSSSTNPFRWGDIGNFLNSHIHINPLESAVWYPYYKVINNYTLWKISAFIFHIIPGLILDGLLIFIGEKPQLTAIHKEIFRIYAMYEYFLDREWIFASDRTQELHEWLCPEEKRSFNLDISSLNWQYYIWGLTQGIKKYECKESMANIERARKKDSTLRILNLILQGIVMFLAWFICSSFAGYSILHTVIFLPIYHYVFNVVL